MISECLHRALIVLCLLQFFSCGKGSDDNGGGDQAVPDALTIADQRVADGSFHTGASAAVEYIGIKTNIADWSASVISDGGGWLAVEPVREPEVPSTGVEVVQKLKITVGENTATAPRNAIVKVSGGDAERTFKIVQAAAGYILTFDTPVHAVATGEVVAVKVTANVGYTVTVGCGWIEDISEASDGYIRLRVGANDAKDARSAAVEVTAVGVPDLRKTLVVEQQGGMPAIDVDGPQEIGAAWDDQYIVINVTANVAYRVNLEYAAAGQEWIWRETTRGMAAKEEKFVLNANLDTEPRVVTVQFLSDDPDVSPAIKREVRVTQEGYTLPSADVFELVSAAPYSIGYKGQSIGIDIRTGKSPGEISVGGLNDWITLAGEPQRNQDILTYGFTVGENGWPLARNGTVTFTADGRTLEAAVRQDAPPDACTLVEYVSLSGILAEGSAAWLCDFDLGTYALNRAGTWPQDWTFGLRKPAANEINRIAYYPVAGIGHYGIGSYELFAFSDTHATWYRAASGTVPGSFYDDADAMRKGFVIGFPTVVNARKLTLRVKSERNGGAAFGAAEMHLTYDYMQNIAPSHMIEIQTVSPLTAAPGAGSASVNISATTPYKVTITGGGGTPDWIFYDADSSAPGILSFTLAANGTGMQRSAVVTLSAVSSGVDIVKSITVVQDAAPVKMELSSPATGVVNLADASGSAERQYFNADLATNLTADDITYGSLSSWLYFEGKSDQGAGIVRFRFSAADNGTGARSHTIRFTGRGRTLDLVVVQAAKPDTDPGTEPEPEPVLTLLSPVPADVAFGASPDPDSFEVVLATNMESESISLSALPEWIVSSAPAAGDGTLTYRFTVGENGAGERSAVIRFSAPALPSVSVTVRQAAAPQQNDRRVFPSKAIYYDRSINSFDAPETIDGDKSTCHTISPSGIWGYEFRFANNTELTAFIYYPRDSDDDHGTFRKIEVEVVCHEGGTSVTPFVIEIPESLFASPASRQKGWRIDLPHKAELVSHLRIIPIEGYLSTYSVAEVEFFAPE